MAVYKYAKIRKYLPPDLNTSSGDISRDISALTPGETGDTSTTPKPKTLDENTTKLLILAVILFALIFLFK